MPIFMNPIISISCSKNEEDIIESFVRVNSQIVDVFNFIDNSTDNTRLILAKLIREGYKINLYESHLTPTEYRQSTLITGLWSKLKESTPGAIFLPLDCDEFPEFTRTELTEVVRTKTNNCIPVVSWKTYVPCCLDAVLMPEGIVKNFRARWPEGKRTYKVIIPPDMISNAIIDEGAHALLDHERKPLRMFDSGLTLAHFPVRSAEQIIIKNITSIIKVARTVQKKEGEGVHIYPVIKQLIENNFWISLERLQEVALLYGNEEDKNKMTLTTFPMLSSCELKYTEKGENNLLRFLGNTIIECLIDPIPASSSAELKIFLGPEIFHKHKTTDTDSPGKTGVNPV